jgi:hypothetical protein
VRLRLGMVTKRKDSNRKGKANIKRLLPRHPKGCASSRKSFYLPHPGVHAREPAEISGLDGKIDPPRRLEGA